MDDMDWVLWEERAASFRSFFFWAFLSFTAAGTLGSTYDMHKLFSMGGSCDNEKK
jgi:hypothetical protein